MKLRSNANSYQTIVLLSLALSACANDPGEAQTSDSEAIANAHEQLYLNGVPWTNGVVPVCWEDGGTNDAKTGDPVSNAATLRQNVRSFIENSWGRVAKITFTGWDSCPVNPKHFTTLRWDSNYPRAACWGLGDPGANGVRPIAISPFSTDLQYRAIHEMGHALGMDHEQQRPDNFDENGNPLYCNPSDANTPNPGGTYLTVYDANSIMNYCSGYSTLSPLDAQGAASVYGLPRLDFNGDGRSDVLWQKQDTGLLSYWYMNGTTKGVDGTIVDTAGNPLSVTGWSVVGLADFNSNGQTDILWQKQDTGLLSYWYMNGTTKGVDGAIIDAAGNPLSVTGWSVVGLADFNDDGRPDILWQKQDTGLLSYWYMNGTTKGVDGTIVDAAGNPLSVTGWSVVGLADFNSDGQTDILWQKQDTGLLSYWYMNGTTKGVDGAIVDTAGNPLSVTGWSVVGLADFDSDGRTDILWQKQGTGLLSYWYMNGTTKGVDGAIVDAAGNPLSVTGWSVVSD